MNKVMNEDNEVQQDCASPLAQSDELFLCFALTRAGQVVWFDSNAIPYSVKLWGEKLVKGGLLDLPAQPLQVITSEEAYQKLTHISSYPEFEIAEARKAKVLSANSGWWFWLFFVVVFGGVGLVILAAHSAPQQLAADITITRPEVELGKPTQTSGYNPIGPPSIKLVTFTEFLRELNSPALSEAGEMYRICVAQGGDPAIALAFFEHESGGGRAGVAAYTHSIGNIRCSAGYRCYTTQNNGSFRSYTSWSEGIQDWLTLLRYYRDVRHLLTLEEIIPVYAPAADHNNEAAYIAAVKKRVDNLRNRDK